MAEVRDKLVDLKSLRYALEQLDMAFAATFDRIKNDIMDNINTLYQTKLNAPKVNGTIGQVLTANGDGTSEWKDVQGSSSSVDEATVRRIVNEQLAKMKFTVNDQGHLIIETPEA